MTAARWTSLSDSLFPWEAEALAWLAEHLPTSEPFRGWSNFEFVAHDGSVNEVDALILTPKQLVLIEIKSRPGIVSGDLGQWTWEEPGGRRMVVENPLVLANRKAKRLKGLLQGAAALRGRRVPYIAAAVFLSHRQVDCRLTGPACTSVFTRSGYHPDRDLLAHLRADCESPGDRIDFNLAKAIIKGLEEIGLRKVQREFTVGDWRLKQLLQETDAYQDWVGTHVRNEYATRRIRLYPWPATGPETGRVALRRAAEREFGLLDRVEHPGILRAFDLKETERGFALLFENPEPSERLDAFLVRRAPQLDLRQRLKLVRELADALTYAHGRHMYHRALTPHAILVTSPDSDTLGVKLLNWQVGTLEELSTGDSKLSWHDFLQVGLGGHEGNAVYLAPELRSGGRPDPALLDVFSLGALAYHLLTGQPPAATAEELLPRLRDGNGLQLAAALDGADQDLATLVQLATSPDLGERMDVATFLIEIDQIIGRLTAVEVEPGHHVHPLDAEAGAELEGGFIVRRRLGSGSTALALEVERDGQIGVLKVARTPELSERIEQEGEVLKQLRHQHVVELFEVVRVGGHAALFLGLAGQQTLAHRLRHEGALTLDLLQRFGEELLTVVDWLEQKGIPHRDFKPDNIGVGETRTGKRTLVLFDFSLSSTPAENIRAGTPGYLDPFLGERRPQRWDSAAERYAAAVTLYEMATGALPQWGDGRQHPATLPQNAVIGVAVERLDPAVREPLTRFFAKGLARDPKARFDTAEEMRRAWVRLFEVIDKPATVTDSGTTDVAAALASAEVGTPLAALGLTPRMLNALERLGVQQVGELAELPRTRLWGTSGIGLRTLREIKELADAAARVLAERGTTVTGETPPPEVDDTTVDPRLWSVDLLARQMISGRLATPDPQVLRQVTGLAAPLDAEGQDAWPSQRDVADALGVSRVAVADVVDRARTRWAKRPWMTVLREDLARLLEAHGGVATREELAASLLMARGSTEANPAERLRKAAAVLWAALEIESTRETTCRYRLQRGDRHLLVVSASGEPSEPPTEAGAMVRWVETLGDKADELAEIDPPLPPQRALEELATIAVPASVPPLTPERLLRLAVSASRAAAISPRQELYPRGFAAERALALGAGALIGAGRLTVDQVRQRVSSRYPAAKPLPGRPALDRLLADAGLALRWDDAADAYLQAAPGSGSLSSSGTFTRQTTIAASAMDPAAEETAELERRLQAVVTEGRFLALTVDPRYLLAAEEKLLARFSLRRVSLERLLLDALREQATALDIAWTVVLAADGKAPSDREWRNLQMLVKKSAPALERLLSDLVEPTLLVNAGLFARYGLLAMLQPLQDRARRGAGIVLLAPADGQQDLPVVNGVTLPIVYATDWARIPKSWLRSAHRDAA